MGLKVSFFYQGEVALKLRFLKVNDFKKEWLRMLKRDWRFFLWTSWLIILGIGIGFNLPADSPFIKSVIQPAFQKLIALRNWYLHAPLIGKIALIWGNNLFASVSSVILGILIFPPVLILIENGAVIGIMQKLLVAKAHIAPFWFYLSLAPHGIFELPAFIMASALGIRFGLIPWRLMVHDVRKDINLKPPLFRDFFHDLPYYAVLILLMLLAAALLEVMVSPILLKMLVPKEFNLL
jgi:stage II sporulation protein M